MDTHIRNVHSLAKIISIEEKINGITKEVDRAYLSIISENPGNGTRNIGLVRYDNPTKHCNQLMNELIKEARKEGCHELACTAVYEHTELLSFYEGLGFKEKGKELIARGEEIKDQVVERIKDKADEVKEDTAKRLDSALEKLEDVQKDTLHTTTTIRKHFVNLPKKK